jgi:small subunit ribosomal protein S3
LGQKVHPNGFRLGIIRDWKAKWYADKQYTEFLMEDLDIRKLIEEKYKDADISMVEVDRGSNQISVTVHTAKPGIVIGRGGQRVDETRAALEKKTGKKVQLNIREVWAPELDALLVAKNIASQITNRVAYRRALKQALTRTMQRGAKGIKINIAGRLNGAEIARRECDSEGSVPLHTLRADIDYGLAEAATTMGRIGIKVWIYKGDILPEHKMDEFEEAS